MTSDFDKRRTHLGVDRLKHLQSLSSIPEPKELFTTAQTALREGPRSPHYLSKGSKRRRTGSPEDKMVNTRAGSQDIILSKAADAGIRPHEYVEMKYGSPWHGLQKFYELKLDGFIVVAIRKPPSCELVTVKNFVGSDSDTKVKRLQQTQHQNFLGFLEAFHSEGSVYIVLDHVPISLAHVVASPAYPTELQLAAVLGQILDGLAYLAFRSLEHGALTCSNLLVTREGIVKIGRSSSRNLRQATNLCHGSARAYAEVAKRPAVTWKWEVQPLASRGHCVAVHLHSVPVRHHDLIWRHRSYADEDDFAMPALRQREHPRSGRAVDVTALDHQIAVHGGTTSTIECLPHRLRRSKVQRTSGPQQRIEELVRDVGHLNQELSYYKDTRKVLMKLFDSVKASHEALQVAVAEADRELDFLHKGNVYRRMARLQGTAIPVYLGNIDLID